MIPVDSDLLHAAADMIRNDCTDRLAESELVDEHGRKCVLGALAYLHPNASWEALVHEDNTRYCHIAREHSAEVVALSELVQRAHPSNPVDISGGWWCECVPVFEWSDRNTHNPNEVADVLAALGNGDRAKALELMEDLW